MSFLDQSAFFYVVMIYSFIEIFDFSSFFVHKNFDSFTKKYFFKNSLFTIFIGVLFFFIFKFFLSNDVYNFFISFMLSLSIVNFNSSKIEKHKLITKKIFILSFILLFFIIEKMLPLIFYFDVEILINILIKIIISVGIGFLSSFLLISINKKHIMVFLVMSIVTFLFGEILTKMGLFSVIVSSIIYQNLKNHETKLTKTKEDERQLENFYMLQYSFRILIFVTLLVLLFPKLNPLVFMICGLIITLWFLLQNQTINITLLPITVLLYLNKNMIGFENYFHYAFSVIFVLSIFVITFNFKKIILKIKSIL